MDEQTINTVYEKLEKERWNYMTRVEETIDARFELDGKRRELRLAGLIVGKNETEREDSAVNQLGNFYSSVKNAEEAERLAKYTFDAAFSDVERVRLIVRVAEITAKQPA